jgi:hypothetical protein
MQRNLLSVCFLSTLVLVIAASCRNTSKGLVIPKDAALAVYINIQSLTSKVSWQEIQQNEWFKNLYAQQVDSLGKRLLEDPSNSGIDVQGDMALFIQQQQQGGYMAFEGGVKNATAFEAFAQKLNKGGRVEKNGDINFLATSLKSLVAWDNNRFIYISDIPSVSPVVPLSDPHKTDSLQKFAAALFDLPQKNNLASDSRFTSLIKEKGDIHYWANAAQYNNSLGGIFSFLKMDALFEGNIYTSTLNFENGKITISTKAYLNEGMRNLMEKYPAGTINTDMINRIPSQHVIAVFALKYPPAAFKDLITLLGIEGIVNGFFGTAGYSTDEFIKANKGDMLLSVSDLEMKEQSFTLLDEDGQPYTVTQSGVPNAKVLFAASVNDKPSFDKLFTILQNNIPDYFPELGVKVHFQLNNDWFVAGNAPEQLNGFLSGGNNHFSFTNRISGHTFGGYIDLQQLLKSISPSLTDSNAKTAVQASLQMWQDVVITSNGKKGDAFTGQAEITLVNKTTNSLKQLNNYINIITKTYHQNQSRYDVLMPYTNPAAPGYAFNTVPALPALSQLIYPVSSK